MRCSLSRHFPRCCSAQTSSSISKIILARISSFHSRRPFHYVSSVTRPTRCNVLTPAALSQRRRHPQKEPAKTKRWISTTERPVTLDSKVTELDPFLPEHLRTSNVPSEPFSLHRVTDILRSGNVLAHMVAQNRNAALFLIEQIIQCRNPQPLQSNIVWPDLRTTFNRPVDLTYKPRQPESTPEGMSEIWSCLGNLIIESSHMSVVLRILAMLHHHGLVPEQIYEFAQTQSTVQRPPILHLLSSRILTALSDAVWRSQQDEIIEEAVKAGRQYHEIGREAPGGRFRLKVRELGPEVWLEFILWCCVESGHPDVACDLIHKLHQTGEWFAMTQSIDWERVKQRTGGTVGRIEGYSVDKPFVDIPSRTISVEVVLATVEELINQYKTPHDQIKTLIGFLEPHSLTPEYLDYLSARILQFEHLTINPNPADLRQWSNTMRYLRGLEEATPATVVQPNLTYKSIILHNELQASIMHQALHSSVQENHVEEAVVLFSEIQEVVDGSKIMAITSFLEQQTAATPDFVDSHGQLPMYRIAGFFNMISYNRLLSLSEWMIYSNDVDGPQIPRSAWGRPSMAFALLSYALEAGDTVVLKSVIAEQSKWKLKTPVTLLRLLASVHIRLLDFRQASNVLWELVRAEGGGFHLSNIAHLAATIMYLESKPDIGEQKRRRKKGEAVLLMQNLLKGMYDAKVNSFYTTQRTLFRQQTGHLLRIFENINRTVLNDIATSFKSRFPISNAPNLDPDVFNIIFDAVSEYKKGHHSSSILAELWIKFVKTPDSYAGFTQHRVFDMIMSQQSTVEDDEMAEEAHNISKPWATGEIAESQDVVQSGGNLASDLDLGDRAEISSLPLESAKGIELISGFVTGNFQNPGLDNPGSKTATKVRKSITKTPAVIPNLKTLRILTRGAHDTRLDTWARELYKSFGLTDRQVERELRLTNPGEGGLVVEGMDTDPAVRLEEKSPVTITKYFIGQEKFGKYFAV